MISVPQLPKSTFDARKSGALCDRCPLSAKGIPVPPEAPRSGRVRLVIVGEQPGRTETKLGFPFRGISGKLLDQVLAESKFSRGDAWTTNAALCDGSEHDEETQAKANVCCAPRLARELSQIPKEIPILTLGKSAAKSLLGVRNIIRTRGFVWEVPEASAGKLKSAQRLVKKYVRAPVKRAAAEDKVIELTARNQLAGRVVLPTLHPAFVLRSELWRPLLSIDIDRTIRYVRGQVTLKDDAPYEVASTAKALKKLFVGFGQTVSVDLETTSAEPLECDITSCSFTDVETFKTVVAWPWKKSFIPVIRAFLKNRTMTGHNLHGFDLIVLGRDDIAPAKAECSLLAHHTYASHFPHSLSQVVSEQVDFRPWKIIHRAAADEKGQSAFAIDNPDLTLYNSRDTVAQAHAWRNMQEDLEPERGVYEHDTANAEVCMSMQIVGMRIDVARRDWISAKLQKRSAALLGEMRKLTGYRDFNPNKPADVRKALFGRFKAPVLALTKTGLRSTAAGTLEDLRQRDTKAGVLADLVLRRRSAEKSDSTFVMGPHIGADGRVHSSWRAWGTETGRFASRKPNLQNLTRYAEGMCSCCGKELPLLRETKKIDGKEVIVADGWLDRRSSIPVASGQLVHCPNGACKPCGGRCKGEVIPSYESMIRSMYVPAPGCVFLYYDLSQSEMRAAAYLSGDPNFIATCESGDVHSGNASILFPEAAALILSDPKGAGKPFRDITKNAGFGILYQAEIETIYQFLLSRGFDVTLPAVSRMFHHIHRKYAVYYKYCSELLKFCHNNGYLRSELVKRIRWLGWFCKVTYPGAFKVSSFIADLMNLRTVKLHKALPKFDDAKGGARIVAQVHDSCITEVRETRVAEVRGLITDVWGQPIEMPNGQKFIMPIDLRGGEDKCPGERWSDFG